MKRTYVNLLLLLATLLLLLAGGEVLVRALGRTDRDGNFYFRGRHLKPYQLPLNAVRDLLDKYERMTKLDSTLVRYRYHPLLGWATNPGHRGRDGYYFNSQGIRTGVLQPTYSPKPDSGRIRIALLGDSFTQSSDVPFEDSWGFHLERNLNLLGYPVEVLNFGCGGYGADQAYLRWRVDAANFAPDIVICGFCPAEIKRTVNIIRRLTNLKDLPFTKPRFVMEADSLWLLNYPVMRLRDLLEVLRNFDEWEFLRYEGGYRPDDYRWMLWRRSRFLTALGDHILYNRFTLNSRRMYRRKSAWAELDSEPAQLTLEIQRQFADDVRSGDARFIIVNLPRRTDILALLEGDELVYEPLLKEFERFAPVVRSGDELVELARDVGEEKLFTVWNHYSPTGNVVVAGVVSDYIAGTLGADSVPPAAR